MSNLPRWLRMGLFLAATWAALILGLAVKTLLLGPSFEAAATEPCPQLLPRLALPVEQWMQSMDQRLFFKPLVWQDAKTGAELALYRPGEWSLKCEQLEQRALAFREAAKSGAIDPRVGVRAGVLALLILVPAFALFVVAFLASAPWSRGRRED